MNWKNALRKVRAYLLEHNMHSSTAERYYHERYASVLAPHLKERLQVLDIGCQYGRFTIPLIQQGHTVTGTDLNAKYEPYIRRKIGGPSRFEFRQEDILTTLKSLEPARYDLLLCTELIYLFKDQEPLLRGMQNLLKPGGILAVSHRSRGHYLYKALSKGHFSTAQSVAESGQAGHFLGQYPQELQKLYAKVGQKTLDMQGIGILSGVKGYDPWGNWLDPGKCSDYKRRVLASMESDPDLQSVLMSNARYIFVISQKP